MYSLHNHTTYCDGKSTVAEMLAAAAKCGIKHFGLSGHSPIPIENVWSIQGFENAEKYCNDIDVESVKYPQMNVYKGLEADYVPQLTYRFSDLKEKFHLDYLIGSVHLVKYGRDIWFIDGKSEKYDEGLKNIFGGDFRLAAKTYYDQINEMLENEDFEILGHCDKIMMNNRYRYMNPSDDFHIKRLQETLMLAKEKDVIVEINTRGIYKKLYDDYYPGKYIFDFLSENKIPVIMSSDAHEISQVDMCFGELKKDIVESKLSECDFSGTKKLAIKKNSTFAMKSNFVN